VFIGGFAFGHWVTHSDPAFLRILAQVRTLQAAGNGQRYRLDFKEEREQAKKAGVQGMLSQG